MKLLRLLPLLVLLAFAMGPTPADTSLDGLWFKVTVKGKGLGVAPGDAGTLKGSVTMHAYIESVLDEVVTDGAPTTTHYKFDVWTETTPGNFTKSTSGESDVVVSDGKVYVVPDLNIFPVDDTNSLSIRATLELKVKHDKNGAVTSAKMSTLGGEVYFGIVQGLFSYGGVKLTGQTVAVDSLPFTPL